MNRPWYHIILKLALVIILVVFAVASATAQYAVYQGQTTNLSVEQRQGDTYTWELYTDPNVDFATTPGNAPESAAEFVNGNTGPSVQVIWHEPGIYFYKVEAWNAVECTNNLNRITSYNVCYTKLLRYRCGRQLYRSAVSSLCGRCNGWPKLSGDHHPHVQCNG